MSTFRSAHRRLRRLARDPRAGLLLVRAGAAIALVDLDLRLGGMARALGASGSLPAAAAAGAGRTVGAAELARAGRYARCIATAARHHPLRARCLHRALVLHRWLRRERLPSEFRIGVQKVNGELNAHAWVELDGVAIGESTTPLTAFAALPGLTDSAAALRLQRSLRWS